LELKTIMERVPTVNYIPGLAQPFLAAGIEPLRGTRGEQIESLMPRSRHSTRPIGLSRFVREQSVFDTPSVSLRLSPSAGAPLVIAPAPTREDSAIAGASPRIRLFGLLARLILFSFLLALSLSTV
jgi:hypothetical protein